jgi:hypothetical protein
LGPVEDNVLSDQCYIAVDIASRGELVGSAHDHSCLTPIVVGERGHAGAAAGRNQALICASLSGEKTRFGIRP